MNVPRIMVNVCSEPQQGDAHILRFVNGLIYVKNNR